MWFAAAVALVTILFIVAVGDAFKDR